MRAISLSPRPSKENTCTSFSTMLPTRIVLPSGEKAAPCDQWPIGASATFVSFMPFARRTTSLPWSA